VKEILLTHGKVALVDDKDFEELNSKKWSVHGKGRFLYAVRNSSRPNRKIIRMHRYLMNPQVGFEVDHIDMNGLNNQRSNLRICTRSQNRCNSLKPKNNTSGFKGVSFQKSNKKFQATIKLNGKQSHIGYFNTSIEAAKAYDIEAIKIYGEFARTNKTLKLFLKD
jgi:hypothetical protein